jgi:RNA polymerase sigma factor (TIGR02999 family)
MTSGEITRLLRAWREGDRSAETPLIEQVYPVLREIAQRRLRGGGSLTLSATELAHEAYFRLVDQRDSEFQNRAHFFAIAAHVIRRLVVDLIRERMALKRGGDVFHVTLEAVSDVAGDFHDGLVVLDVDQLLQRLERIDARAARITELRFFAGLSVEEVAEAEGLSPATVKRSWQFARAWLRDQLESGARTATPVA